MRRQGSHRLIPYPFGRVAMSLIAAGAAAVGALSGSGHGGRHAAAAARRAIVHPAAIVRTAPSVPLPRSDAKLLGQRIMVGFDGTTAPGWLLRAARAGQVGGVILFGRNLTSRAQSRALTGALQAAARVGRNPPLLVSTDQEGGEVKRIPGAPDLSPPQMARAGAAAARREGRATGELLRGWGVEMDLAPVADVPTSSRSFMALQGRTFSADAAVTTRVAAAFAAGLQSAHVAATAKHFPGIGSATIDTDDAHEEQLRPTASERAAALEPYRTMIGQGIDAVMASDAGFPADDRSGTVAALSHPIVTGLLRGRLRFGGVVITDSLGAQTGHDPPVAGTDAARAGSDVLLYGDAEPGVLPALQRALRSGSLSRASADASYRRIVALKRTLGVA